MFLQQLAQIAQLLALEYIAADFQAQALGQAGTRIFHAHHALDPQAQPSGEVVITDLAFNHHHRVSLQQRLRRMKRLGKQRRFNARRAVVEGDKAHLVAFFVLHHPQRDNHPGNGLGITGRLEINNALAGKAADLTFVLVNRMTGQVQAQRVLLAFESLLERQFPGLAVVGIDVRIGLDEQAAKQVGVAAVMGARSLFGGLDRFFQRRQQHRTVLVDVGLPGFGLVMEKRPQAVKGTAADQAIEGALVDALEVNPGAKIEQISERPVLACLGNGFDRPLAHPLDRPKTINDPAFIVYRELELGGIHIRRVETQLHAANLFDQDHHLVGVVHIRRQYRGHKWRRVMGFQPGRLVRHQAVGSGVGFVETVTGEFFHQVENVTCKVRVNIVIGATFDETATLLGHFFGFFLAHGPAQHVCAAEGIAGHDLGNLHHLFLIQDDAVGWCQYGLEAFVLIVRVRVRQFGAAVLTVDKVINHA